MATLTIRIPDAHRDRWAAGYVLSIAINLDPVALSILDVGVGLKLLRGTLQRSANQAPAGAAPKHSMLTNPVPSY